METVAGSVLVSERSFLAFDLETTGVDVRLDEPVSYALVTRDNGHDEPVYRITTPRVPIHPDALAVHGISDERVAQEGVPLEDALREIGNGLVRASRRGAVLVGMNVAFDLTITNRLLTEHFGKGLIEAGWRGPIVDVSVLDRAVDKYRSGKRTLTALCEYYDVAFENAHDALADATVCMDLAKTILDQHPDVDALGSIELLKFQAKQYRSWAHNYNQYRLSRGESAIELYETWPMLIDVPSWEEVLADEAQVQATTQVGGGVSVH